MTDETVVFLLLVLVVKEVQIAAESRSVFGLMGAVLTPVVTLSAVEAIPLIVVVKVTVMMISVPIVHVAVIGYFHQILKETKEL